MVEKLTPGGWIFMCAAWGFLILLNLYCYAHLLKEKKEKIVDPITDDEVA